MNQLLLRNALVIDGRNTAPFMADVAIEDDRIIAIDKLVSAGADLVLDLDGLVVVPGFIDAHSHSDTALLYDPSAAPKVAQGITTEIVGHCGWGPFPLRSEEAVKTMAVLLPTPDNETAAFSSAVDYRAALAVRGTAVNVVALAPHGALRSSVMGNSDRAANARELDQMCELLHESLAEGASGLSFGLLYAPGCFTPFEELVALARVVAGRGSATLHVRNECDLFEQSVREALEVGRRSLAHIHISHLKIADPHHWGKAEVLLAQLERARAEGLAVSFDQYPYTAGSGPLQTLLPPWALVGGAAELLRRLRETHFRNRLLAALEGREPVSDWKGIAQLIGWERIIVGYSPGREEYEGQSIASIAAYRGDASAAVLLDILEASGATAVGIYQQMEEKDVRSLMAHSAQMVGTDGLPLPGKPHPRLWGTFPRFLRHYVIERGVLTLPEAIGHTSAAAAHVFGLVRRGELRSGWFADICVFNLEELTDMATFERPTLPPQGIVHVICNGRPTLLYGERTEQLPGRWLAREKGQTST